MGFNSLNIGFGAAGSGGGTTAPGGSNTDVQFNDNGVFGGTDDFTFNKATKVVGLTGGLSITQGTLTSSFPYLTHSATWNNAGVNFQGFVSNITKTAAGGSSTMFDLQLGGSSMFQLDRFGDVLFTGGQFIWRSQQATLNITTFGGNNTPLTLQGYSSTGTDSNSNILSMTGTWNTSGSPSAIHLAMTNTASGSDTSFEQFILGTTIVYNVSKNGSVSINTNATPAASLDIKGQGSTTATKSINVSSNNGSYSFIVRDDCSIATTSRGYYATNTDDTLDTAVNLQTNTTSRLFLTAAGSTHATPYLRSTAGVGAVIGDLLLYTASSQGGNPIIRFGDNYSGTNFNETLRISKDGQFGFNSSSPTATFDFGSSTTISNTAMRLISGGSSNTTTALEIYKTGGITLVFQIKDGGLISAPLLASSTTYANNAAAIAGGLVAGNFYRTGSDPDYIAIVH